MDPEGQYVHTWQAHRHAVAGIQSSSHHQWPGVSDHDMVADDFAISTKQQTMAFTQGRPLRALEGVLGTAPEW